jgi:UDP-N-acetyl-D-glucosamine dehydrogenase
LTAAEVLAKGKKSVEGEAARQIERQILADYPAESAIDALLGVKQAVLRIGRIDQELTFVAGAAFYLTWVARKYRMTTRFIDLAGEINTSMPRYVVGRIGDALNERGKPIKGSKIALLGMAYKNDVDDARESPGLELMELLLDKGAVVQYNDPHIPRLLPSRHYPHLRMESQALTPEFLRTQDCLVIVTAHSAYNWPEIVTHARLLVDTRNATRNITKGREKIVSA